MLFPVCQLDSLAAPLPRLIKVNASCERASNAAARAWAALSALANWLSTTASTSLTAPACAVPPIANSSNSNTPATAIGTLISRRNMRANHTLPTTSAPRSNHPSNCSHSAGAVSGGQAGVDLVTLRRLDGAQRRDDVGCVGIGVADDAVGLPLVRGPDREALAVVGPGLLDQTDVAAQQAAGFAELLEIVSRGGGRHRHQPVAGLGDLVEVCSPLIRVLLAADEVRRAGYRIGVHDSDANVLQGEELRG